MRDRGVPRGPLRPVVEENDREIPDARITRDDRARMKRLVENVAQDRTAEELMFLSCAFEEAANRKREGRLP